VKDNCPKSARIMHGTQNILNGVINSVFFHQRQYVNDTPALLANDSISTTTFTMDRTAKQVAMNWYLSELSLKNAFSALEDNTKQFTEVKVHFKGLGDKK
jgi:hypothetical protein